MRRSQVLVKSVALILVTGALGALAPGFWIPAKAALAQLLLERAWREARQGHSEPRPWPWADTFPMARLAIPRLGRSWIVLSGASGRNLAFAPSYMQGSAEPGERGVTVVAGHRDTHFAALERIRLGDHVNLQDTGGANYRYQVSRIEVVDVRNASLRLDVDRSALVLATCYPFDALTAGGPLRFLVEAEAIGP